MRSTTQEKLLNILFKALKPFVHLLLESGIGHREFSETCKKAFVDVATKKYGIRGRATNISRVAVMTGLTRKEVKRIREGLDGENDPQPIKQIPASSVLHHWHTDSDFLTNDGVPRPLAFHGDEDSFAQLVKKYAGDIPPGALRTELVRAGAVAVRDDGKLVALRRMFRILDSEDVLFWSLNRSLTGAIANLAHNHLDRESKMSNGQLWPQRIVEASGIETRQLSRIRKRVADHASEFTHAVDDVLTPFENTVSEESGGGATVLVGLFYMEEKSS